MQKVIIISDVWGPADGGINAFNEDFTLSLGNALKTHYQVICIVKKIISTIPDPIANNVKLLVLDTVPSSQILNDLLTEKVLRILRDTDLDKEIIWWIGHDVRTGFLAVDLKKQSKLGQVALIHHMSYSSYQVFKNNSSLQLKDKEEEQKRLFSQADRAFGVGPLLRDALIDLIDTGSPIETIVPGLANIVVRKPPQKFTAIVFGRLDIENDRIKQSLLAIDSFAEAVRKTKDETFEPDALLNEPQLYGIGLSTGNTEDEKTLRKRVNLKAKRVVNFKAYPYLENRTELFEALRNSSVALMLSLHDGFGLAGWEAIAAEIPLIVGVNTGIHRLIKENCGPAGLALIKSVNIRGAEGDENEDNYTQEDLEEVQKAITEIARKVSEAKECAKELRSMLINPKPQNGRCGFTKEMVGKRFAKDLGLISYLPDCFPSVDSLNSWSYEETARYASIEVKERFRKNGLLSFFSIDDSIRLLELDLNGNFNNHSDTLKVECNIPDQIAVSEENLNPTDKELNCSIQDFNSLVKAYLNSDGSFQADSAVDSQWKIGIELIKPPTDIPRVQNYRLIIRPLSFLATNLFNRRIINGKASLQAGHPSPYPNLDKLYEQSVSDILSTTDIFNFNFPSQMFIELAILTSDEQVILVRKKAGPGGGVVANIGRSWTCGPEFGLTFNHLEDDNSILLDNAITSSLDAEFGIEKKHLKNWHISGLALQQVHLNTALYGFCQINLTGAEVASCFIQKRSKQFHSEVPGPHSYPELIPMSDILNLVREERRYDGQLWHPSAKIRLYSLYQHLSGRQAFK